jgi:hypothetical protein
MQILFSMWNSPARHGHEIVSGETGGPRRARPSRRAPFFSRLGYGGSRSPEPFGLESFDPELMAERPVEGNAEPRFLKAGRKQVAEKTSTGASERKKGFHGMGLLQCRLFPGGKAIIQKGIN